MTKLIWLTDLHLVRDGTPSPADVDPLQRLRLALGAVRADHGDADLLVISGDLVQRGHTEAYHALRQALEGSDMPCRLLVGNHDDRTSLQEAFPENPWADGFVQGVDDLGHARILYLDTQAADGAHHGELCSRRLDWIEEEVGSASDRPLLVFLHHPPCDIGVPALDRLRLANNARFRSLIEGRAASTHLLCGHVHRNATGAWAGHPLTTLKSTHSQFAFNTSADRLTRTDEPPGYAVILTGPEGIMINLCDVTPG